MDNFSEKLIEAIRERPFLYDLSHNDYKNNFIKTMAWTEIANEIGGESGEAIKEKWKNLRHTYKKHKKSLCTSSGQAVKKLKNWVWATHMQFLDASVTMRTTEDTPLISITVTSDEASPNTPSNIQASTSAATLPTTTPNSDTRPEQTTEESIQQQNIGNRRKRKNDDVSDIIIYYLGSKRSKKHGSTTNNLDKIDYLFLNYADTFKRLTPRQQALLKLEFAKLLAAAELANMDCIEVSSRNTEATTFSDSSAATFDFSTASRPYSVSSNYSNPGQIINLAVSNENDESPQSAQILQLSTPDLDTHLEYSGNGIL